MYEMHPALSLKTGCDVMAREHREDKEGECFVRFGHGGGLTPSGITVKVRTCKEENRFGFRSHWP
jgi:hypothetical protein